MADDKTKKPAQGETHHYSEEDLLRDQLKKQEQAEKAKGDDGKTSQGDNKG